MYAMSGIFALTKNAFNNKRQHDYTIQKLCICQIFAHVPVLWQKQKPSEEAKSVVQRRVAGVFAVKFATSGVVPFFCSFSP
jgi:hypothetical protein